MVVQIDSGEHAASRAPTGAPLWGRAFRPFFLAVGVYACTFVAAWTAIWAVGQARLRSAPRCLEPMTS